MRRQVARRDDGLALPLFARAVVVQGQRRAAVFVGVFQGDADVAAGFDVDVFAGRRVVFGVDFFARCECVGEVVLQSARREEVLRDAAADGVVLVGRQGNGGDDAEGGEGGGAAAGKCGEVVNAVLQV